ncbi:MAG TPA: tRNA pseudouridine(55) synthase TruB [Streptosporangiaceae bacterium]|nr:tRNA pseudouridine(55) synthase TruB [Streptosporangiaceae bacterium]
MPQSGLVIVAKPGGMTSHDVVARMRKLAGTRRVGHAGTLDPMATGVLVIGIEKATRLLGHLTLTEKDYLATIRLGQSTVTDDAEGDILSPDDGAMPVNSVTREALHAALADLTGEIQQVPPKVSAIKVKGQRAYHLTRSGAAPELTARPVTIWRLDLLAIRPAGELLDIDIEVTCSSGTYIRALARDLGVALRTGGHLTELRRTRVGPYRIDEARTLEQLAEHVDIIPLARAAAEAFPSVQLNETETRLISHGVRLPASPEVMASRVVAPMPAAAGTVAHSSEPGASSIRAGEPIAAFAPDGSLIALVTEREAELQPVAVFVP